LRAPVPVLRMQPQGRQVSDVQDGVLACQPAEGLSVVKHELIIPKEIEWINKYSVSYLQNSRSTRVTINISHNNRRRTSPSLSVACSIAPGPTRTRNTRPSIDDGAAGTDTPRPGSSPDTGWGSLQAAGGSSRSSAPPKESTALVCDDAASGSSAAPLAVAVAVAAAPALTMQQQQKNNYTLAGYLHTRPSAPRTLAPPQAGAFAPSCTLHNNNPAASSYPCFLLPSCLSPRSHKNGALLEPFH